MSQKIGSYPEKLYQLKEIIEISRFPYIASFLKFGPCDLLTLIYSLTSQLVLKAQNDTYVYTYNTYIEDTYTYKTNGNVDILWTDIKIFIFCDYFKFNNIWVEEFGKKTSASILAWKFLTFQNSMTDRPSNRPTDRPTDRPGSYTSNKCGKPANQRTDQ